MGDPNASIPTPQPVHYRPMFGAYGRAPHRVVRGVCLESGGERPGLAKNSAFRTQLVAVQNTRAKISKKSLIHNNTTPKIEVDPETYEVRADGELLTCEPAEVLPMAQRYFLF